MRIPSSTLPTRATTITNESRSEAVTVTTGVTLVLFALMFLSREAIKFTVVRKFAIDDLFTLLALLFAIGLSITTLILASDGLGSFAPLTVRRAKDIMKEYYASNFLYIATIGFAKLSLVTFFYSIYVQRTYRRFVLGFGFLITAWTFASLVAVAFQCGIPHPWEVMTLHCYNSGAFWIVYCIIDMTTDVSIIMLSVNLVIFLKLKASRKIAVVACFAPRILVIGASMARLVYLYPITPHTNPAYNLWVPVICTQVQVSLSIVTACIPYMRPFFYGSESELRGGGSKRNVITVEEEHGRFSSGGYTRGHERGWDRSDDSTATNSLRYGHTPDVSPRIQSPPSLSPLTPPRLRTPPKSSASSCTSRSPSERGLRLHIPSLCMQVQRATVVSPQTASSHALSPDCISPQPLPSGATVFSPIPLTPPEPAPPPRSFTPPNITNNSYDSDPEHVPAPSRRPTQRFSLFPALRSPRYSLVPQMYPQLPRSNPTPISERSRPSSRSQTLGGAMPVPRTTPQATPPETRTPASSSSPQHRTPNTRDPLPVPSIMALPPSLSTRQVQIFPGTTSAGFATVAYDDPLRMRALPAAALTPSAPIPNSLKAPASTANFEERKLSFIPYYYVKPPPMAQNINTKPSSSQQQSSPLSYISTPPSSQPPSFVLPHPAALAHPMPPLLTSHASPYQHEIPPIIPSPTSPPRQHNQQILKPHFSSRSLDHNVNESPISPISPLTLRQYWREEALGNGPGRPGRGTVPSIWEEQVISTGTATSRPVDMRGGERDQWL